jgi:hypothetical protein
MRNYGLHLLFHILGATLGYMVMAYAPTMNIFAAGSITFSVSIFLMVWMFAAKMRGEI